MELTSTVPSTPATVNSLPKAISQQEEQELFLANSPLTECTKYCRTAMRLTKPAGLVIVVWALVWWILVSLVATQHNTMEGTFINNFVLTIGRYPPCTR